MVNILSFLIL